MKSDVLRLKLTTFVKKMDLRKEKLDLIARRLNYLKVQIIHANSLNLTDINIHAENFYRDFYNLMGYSFDNVNFDSQNFANIDLIDSKNKIAIQITSQNDNNKIKEAIDGFYKKVENKEYQLKLLLISKDAKEYKTKFGDKFDHKKDVIDTKRLLAEINNKKTHEIEEIADFLDKEVLTERRKTESTEVETIMALIDFLSKDSNRVFIERTENVDPANKIYKRFSEHSDFIIEQYQELFSVYNIALVEATKNIDSVKAIIISSYLRDESDQILTDEGNNPKKALSRLVDFFEVKLSKHGFRFDKIAIKFYLLDELIKCNVFPN